MVTKYTPTLTAQITELYGLGRTAAEIGEIIDAPERSVISKLSSLGIYNKKQYLTKRGELPVRKAEYIEKIADILDEDVESLESLEKVTKSVLIMLLAALSSK